MEGLRKLEAQFPGILPQGDTGSPLIWLAVYDILLRALTIQRKQLQNRLAHAVNYADDLKSIAGNLGSLQEHTITKGKDKICARLITLAPRAPPQPTHPLNATLRTRLITVSALTLKYANLQ